MLKRGKVLRDTNAGPGLLTVEGKQYTFTLEEMWTSDVPPRTGMTVAVAFDAAGAPEKVSAVAESQLAREGATAVLADARRHSGALANGLVRRLGLGTAMVVGILLIAWLFLPSLVMQLPYGGANCSFWALLSYVNAPNTAMVLGQDPRFLSSGIWGLLGAIALVGPLVAIVWKDKRAALGGVLPFAFMLLVFLMLWASIGHASGPATGNASLDSFAKSFASEAVNRLWQNTSLGVGAYVSFLCSLYLAVLSVRRYFAAKG